MKRMIDIEKKIEEIEEFRKQLDANPVLCINQDYDECCKITCRDCVIDHVIAILRGGGNK